MIIVVDGIEFILTMISITASIIFAIVQVYAKLRAIFRETVEEIVKNEIQELHVQITLLKESNARLEREIEEIKHRLEQGR